MRNFFLACLIFSACGDDVTADQGCTSFAQGFCGKIDQCAHPIIATQYGDVATCVTRQKLNCLNGLKAPGTTVTPAKAQSCGNAAGSTSCTDIFNHNLPAACHGDPGKLVDGTVCSQDGQCQSTYCKKANSSDACGACGERSASGGPCSRAEDCQYNLACGANMQCTAWVGSGGTCDANHPCSTPLLCRGGTCAMPAGSGQPCVRTVQGDNCDLTQGLFCNGAMTGTCQMLQYANAGQACGLSANPVNFTACTASSTCSANTNGTCVAPGADGAACGTGNVGCTPPANCVNRVCTLPDYTGCH
jgi:hypothetical protein